MNSNPDCSKWNIWEGLEIEGFTDINEKTLFIRNASIEDILKYSKNYNRIWFCAEYLIDNFCIYKNFFIELNKTKKVVIAIKSEDYKKYPKYLLDEFQLYIQFNDFNLKDKDHIKFGVLYEEESFMIGLGKKAKKSLYLQDKFIK